VFNKLSPKAKSFKKSDIKVPRTENTSRDRRLSISYLNVSRRNDQNANSRVQLRTNVDRVRRLGNMINDNIIIDSQTYTNELFRLRLENDQTRIVENLINRPNIDQNTR